MVERIEKIAIEIKMWEPTPNQATFGVENGTFRGTIVFSSLRGFVSGAELLDDPEVPVRLVDAIHRVTVDGPCQQVLCRRALEELNETNRNNERI